MFSSLFILFSSSCSIHIELPVQSACHGSRDLAGDSCGDGVQARSCQIRKFTNSKSDGGKKKGGCLQASKSEAASPRKAMTQSRQTCPCAYQERVHAKHRTRDNEMANHGLIRIELQLKCLGEMEPGCAARYSEQGAEREPKHKPERRNAE